MGKRTSEGTSMNTPRSDGSKTLGASLPPPTSCRHRTHTNTLPCNHGNTPRQSPPHDQPLLPPHPQSWLPSRTLPLLRNQCRAWTLTSLYRQLYKQPPRPMMYPSQQTHPFPPSRRPLLSSREDTSPHPQKTSSARTGTETSTPSPSSKHAYVPGLRAPLSRGH